jgi:hypothetical protein
LLPIGDDLTLRDIERILSKRQNDQAGSFAYLGSIERGGAAYINPELPSFVKKGEEAAARRRRVPSGSLEEDPRLRGRMLEAKKEHYPTIRWNFPWEEYVLVGVPDGLTKRFAYEFKTCQYGYLARRYVKPVATAQADLYACFFKRPMKRVQIYVLENAETCTVEEPADNDRALDTLRGFRDVDGGAVPRLPAVWKCKPVRCEYADSCEFRRARTSLSK